MTTRALVEAGHEVLAVDSSAPMLQLARRAAPRAHFMHASAFDVELPECAAIVAVGEVLSYSERSLDPFFQRAARALKPGGLLVADLAGRGRVPDGCAMRTWFEGEDWAILVETVEDADSALLTRRMTTFSPLRRWVAARRGDSSPAAPPAERRRAPAAARRLPRPDRRGYAGERFAPGHFVVLANRSRADRV